MLLVDDLEAKPNRPLRMLGVPTRYGALERPAPPLAGQRDRQFGDFGPLGGLHGRRDKRAPAGVAHQQPPCRQLPECPAHWRPADPQPGAQLILGRQPVSRPQLTACDLSTDERLELVGDWNRTLPIDL